MTVISRLGIESTKQKGACSFRKIRTSATNRCRFEKRLITHKDLQKVYRVFCPLVASSDTRFEGRKTDLQAHCANPVIFRNQQH